jgi:hypothetical protein
MFVVQPGRGNQSDEELRTVGVGPRIRHAHRVRPETQYGTTIPDTECRLS